MRIALDVWTRQRLWIDFFEKGLAFSREMVALHTYIHRFSYLQILSNPDRDRYSIIPDAIH
jgi:hypothetical protein